MTGWLRLFFAILVDKSPTTLIVPTTINELYQTPEDYYYSFWLGSFLRLIRLLGNNLAVALPGLYIALVVYHPELIPTQLALTIAGTRARIPVPLIAEVLILDVAVEVFRGAGLRLPGAVGQTLGVVAGVVLGLTAVQAGFISPATLVVIAVAAIASFTGLNYSMGIAWRLLKFLMTIAAGVLGLYGLTIAGVWILTHAADLKSFGVSYLAPWAPLQWRELADGPVRKPFWARWPGRRPFVPAMNYGPVVPNRRMTSLLSKEKTLIGPWLYWSLITITTLSYGLSIFPTTQREKWTPMPIWLCPSAQSSHYR